MECVCNLRAREVEAGGSHLSGLSVQTDIQSRLNGELCHTCTHKRRQTLEEGHLRLSSSFSHACYIHVLAHR